MGDYYKSMYEKVSVLEDENAALTARLVERDAEIAALREAVQWFVGANTPPDGTCLYCPGHAAHEPWCPVAKVLAVAAAVPAPPTATTDTTEERLRQCLEWIRNDGREARECTLSDAEAVIRMLDFAEYGLGDAPPTAAPLAAAERDVIEAASAINHDGPNEDNLYELMSAVDAWARRAGRRAMIDLDELDRLAQAATPGPWEASEYQDGDWDVSVTDDQGELYVAIHQARLGARFMADAAFIVACDPETVRALVAVVRAQGAMLRRLEWAVDWSRFGIASNHCPVCGNERSHGHAPDCELAALLAALPGAAGTGGEGQGG